MRFALALLLVGGVAYADPAITVSPDAAHPGDPVLVEIKGVTQTPQGKAGGQPLHFFRARDGYQAVFAVPLAINETHMLVEGGGAKPVSVAVTPQTWKEDSVTVEDELANPDAADRAKIDADNAAIGKSYEQAAGVPQFGKRFARPGGSITSGFGEWRTFNDGHRSQHLGTDFGVTEGSKVLAAASGTVVLVRETFLMGNVVVVAHGGGISSLYFHLQKPLVAEGDAVSQGKAIGLTGHTGRTTGPHLHLSIHTDGGMVDPIAFLKLAIAPNATIGVAKK